MLLMDSLRLQAETRLSKATMRMNEMVLDVFGTNIGKSFLVEMDFGLGEVMSV